MTSARCGGIDVQTREFVYGMAGPVAELVDEDVVAHHERRDHRAAGDLERLDDERAQRERHGDRHEDRLDVLAHLALAPAPEADVDLPVGA